MKTIGYHKYYVYIITNRTKTVLYIGMTNSLARRLYEHRENISFNKKAFAAKYKCQFLLYYEEFAWVYDAIAREKEIKRWRREKKMALISSVNPELRFLDDWFPFEPSSKN